MSKAAGQLTYIPFGRLDFDDDQSTFGSSLYDIYRGTFNGQIVAIKKARQSPSVQQSVEHILKEANNWRSACELDPAEEYILKLIGVSFPKKSFIMVSRWMVNCDVLTYIAEQVARGIDVDRKHMIQRIAKGLEILHSHMPPIAHGHLRGSNIIINDNGNPLLGDFGLSKSLKNLEGHPMTVVQGVDSVRWFAPEVVSGDLLISTRSDVYSFAMTVLELMTGKSPFDHFKIPYLVPSAVLDGMRPERPMDRDTRENGLNDRLWGLLTRCWAQNPLNRPDMIEVREELESVFI